MNRALVSLVQGYNISTDWKADVISVIKLLRCAIKSIIAMRLDTSSCRQQLPGLYIKHMLMVLQTSNVVDFTHKIKQYHDKHEFQRYQTGDRSNSPKVLGNVFTFTLGIHTEMRALGSWQETLLSIPKSSFTTNYSKDKCWNCKKTGYSSISAPSPLMKQNVVNSK